MHKLRIHKFLAATLLAAGIVGAPACAADEARAVPAIVVGSTIRASAEVVAIDLPSRKVSLKDQDGKVSEIVVGEEVKNLPQVKVGDRVVAQYGRALSVKLKKGPGLRITEEKSDSASAAPGEKPAAAATSEIHFVADVVKVSSKSRKITIKGAKGRLYELAIKDPEVLSQIKVGDQVEGTYLQVLSIGVQGAPVKK